MPTPIFAEREAGSKLLASWPASNKLDSAHLDAALLWPRGGLMKGLPPLLVNL